MLNHRLFSIEGSVVVLSDTAPYWVDPPRILRGVSNLVEMCRTRSAALALGVTMELDAFAVQSNLGARSTRKVVERLLQMHGRRSRKGSSSLLTIPSPSGRPTRQVCHQHSLPVTSQGIHT